MEIFIGISYFTIWNKKSTLPHFACTVVWHSRSLDF